MGSLGAVSSLQPELFGAFDLDDDAVLHGKRDGAISQAAQSQLHLGESRFMSIVVTFWRSTRRWLLAHRGAPCSTWRDNPWSRPQAGAPIATGVPLIPPAVFAEKPQHGQRFSVESSIYYGYNCCYLLEKPSDVTGQTWMPSAR